MYIFPNHHTPYLKFLQKKSIYVQVLPPHYLGTSHVVSYTKISIFHFHH